MSSFPEPVSREEDSASAQTGFVPIDSSEPPMRRQISPAQPETNSLAQPSSISASNQPVRMVPEVPHVWRNAGRAQRWQPLPRLSLTGLRWAKGGSAIGLFLTLCLPWWVAKSALWTQFEITTRLLRWSAAVPVLEVPVLGLGLSLLILFFAAPWMLDAALRLDGLQPLSTAEIARHSPETHRLIQRFAQQHKISVPKLGVLPTQLPIALTYGCLPKFSRIVVSHGLLESLNEDEIAAVFAYELGHIFYWDFAWMSLITVVIQIPFVVYRQCAIVSDQLRKIKLKNSLISKLTAILSGAVSLIATIAYSFFWLFRGSGFCLSKQRVIYADRQACNLTGNPNGLARALIKISIATARIIQSEKKTNYLLEGFEQLNPISYRSAVLLEILFDRVSLSTVLQWDGTNRSEAGLNSSHSLIGNRLAKIMSYCQDWQLQPELEIEMPMQTNQKRNLLQFAPYIGIGIGILIALLLWLIAQALFAIGNFRFIWLASDYNLFQSFALIGFGVGTIVRFNRFFPEPCEIQTDLLHLVSQPNLTSIDSPTVRLEGTLIGRTGASNQLAQHLMLRTEIGSIKLHYCSQFGAIGNLLCDFPIGRSAIVTGWFRSGAAPWIDVDTIRGRSYLRAGHPIWSMSIAVSAILLGIARVL